MVTLHGPFAARAALNTLLPPLSRCTIPLQVTKLTGHCPCRCWLCAANRAQALRSECDTWKTRSEGLTLELKSVQRKLQAAEGEQSLLADRCSTLEGGKLAAEEQVRGLQSQLTAIRQAGDHTQRELHSKLAQRDTELLRLQGEQGQAMERIDELRAQVDKQAQVG